MDDERIAPGSEKDERIAPAPAFGGPSAPGPESAHSPRRRKAIAGIVAACSVVLIGVSAFFLVPAMGQDAAPGMLQTTSEQADKAANNQEAQASQDKAASDKSAADAASAGEADASAAGSGDEASTAGAGATDGGGGSSSSLAGASSESTAPSGGSSSNAGRQPQDDTVTVSISVSSSAVGNPVSGGTTATFAKGSTVYDALMACGLSVNATPSSFGTYVNAIGGLAQFDHGGGSGWVYTVNGQTINVACSSQVLQNGDTVSWFYTTG
ncbi:MAG: DUF4430 domain-containing protein [Gordonibacter sp.]